VGLFVHAMKNHFIFAGIPHLQSCLSPQDPVHSNPSKNKSRWKKEKKERFNDFQPHKLPPSTPTKADKEIKSVAPFPLEASASSQSLLKWKEKSGPLPHLNGCWKSPQSLRSKLTGLDGNTIPYCFGTSCQLMTQQNDFENSQEKYIYSK